MQTAIDYFGYFSSAVIVIAFMVNDIFWLRVFNIIGCSLFIIYGFLLTAYPVIVLNLLVISINLYKLYKEKK